MSWPLSAWAWKGFWLEGKGESSFAVRVFLVVLLLSCFCGDSPKRSVVEGLSRIMLLSAAVDSTFVAEKNEIIIEGNLSGICQKK